jgi:integrase/recombinase XerD
MQLDYDHLTSERLDSIDETHDAIPLWSALPHTLPADGKPRCGKRSGKPARNFFPQANVARLHLHAAAQELEAALARKSDRSADHLIPTVRPGSKEAERRKVGPTKRARLIEEEDLKRILAYIDTHSRSPESDRVKVLLSVRAGLRSCEIAGMTYRNCMMDKRRAAKNLRVGAASSKSVVGRDVPIHGSLRVALEVLARRYPDAPTVAFSLGKHGQVRAQSAAAVTHWFCQLYKKVGGLEGCSSHSGRRTFATRIARGMEGSHSSMADLQKLMGHQSISSTECYLEPSRNVAELVLGL